MIMGNFLTKITNYFYNNAVGTFGDNNDTIKYKVWLNSDNKDFIYPENDIINDKLDIGLCLSGGGMRACNFSFGCLRSLYELNLLDKIKYISANSGSTWIVTPLSYMNQNINLNNFFDKYIHPEDLTLDKLHQRCLWQNINKESFINLLHNIIITDDIIKNYFKNLLDGDKYNIKDNWSITMSDIFLKQYDLYDFNKLPSINNKRKDVPYPIITGTVYIDNKTDLGTIEFTPLYYGLCNKIQINNKYIGCNYIEPNGFNAVKSNNINSIINQIDKSKNILEIITTKPDNIISISKCMGISSNAFAVPCEKYINNTINNLLDFNSINYFDYNSVNPTIINKLLRNCNDYYFNDYLRLTDGALFDNTAILPLLRRQLKKIIMIDNAPYNTNEISTDVFKSNIGNCLAGLFGVATFNGLYYGYTQYDYNKYRKVFDHNKWDDLINLIKNKQDNNQSICIKIKLDVLDNQYNGVRGYKDLELIIIISSKCDWIDKLPEETKEYIKNNKRENIIENFLEYLQIENEEFEDFPHISTLKLNYSKELVVSLTQLGSYHIYNNKDLILDFIK